MGRVCGPLFPADASFMPNYLIAMEIDDHCGGLCLELHFLPDVLEGGLSRGNPNRSFKDYNKQYSE